VSGSRRRRSQRARTGSFEAPAPNRKWIADFTLCVDSGHWLMWAAVRHLFRIRPLKLSQKSVFSGANEVQATARVLPLVGGQTVAYIESQIGLGKAQMKKPPRINRA